MVVNSVEIEYTFCMSGKHTCKVYSDERKAQAGFPDYLIIKGPEVERPKGLFYYSRVLTDFIPNTMKSRGSVKKSREGSGVSDGSRRALFSSSTVPLSRPAGSVPNYPQ